MPRTYASIYQIALLIAAAAVVILTAFFVHRELFPEYKQYQKAFVEIETLRTGKAPEFKYGIKQILYRVDEPGPESIDRCISCHVATQIPAYSPTRLSYDINGKMRVDAEGVPIQESNPDYVFDRPGMPQDMAKVLAMHPLMGRETRPFEYHPLDEYGCTSCHSGNGRSVNANRAHGPVYDEQYEATEGSEPSPFVELDEANDPEIAHVFNYKPGHDLLFQTTPILPGPLMEAKCAQCHQSSKDQVSGVIAAADVIGNAKALQTRAIDQGLADDRAALITIQETKKDLSELGEEETVKKYRAYLSDPSTTPEERDGYAQRIVSIEQGFPITEEELQEAIAQKTSSLERSRAALSRLEGAKVPFQQLLDERALVHEIAPFADKILDSYERGEELFFNQACYGCHRIEGLSRGGVGPDLTLIGESYPWYVKMSIVWPQGKLPGSAMPNFKLDHVEVENLLAFLMAQTDDEKALSEMEKNLRKSALEKGKKLPWEEPIPPGEIRDLGASMTIFATEGCAACHRMKGFEGNVEVSDQEWFYQQFPERTSGARIAEILRSQAAQVNQKIIRNERTDTILQQIDPEVVAGFYPEFRVAMRAGEGREWKELVDRVRTAFIQEYGFGGNVGPRLNWSGVWRDDAWLLGHFLNPTTYSPRSIMPAFGFDKTKYYALDFMLQSLGKKNRNELQELWSLDGFDPELAYQLQCAACHGDQKQGNGPVAEWIYPIPKNLRNSEFLRNLTKEQAIGSITHGVKGTPMPPWGEAVEGQQPVMTEAQIVAIVDWLYATLPGSPLTDEAPRTEKWQYTPEEVMNELHTSQQVFDLVDGKYYLKQSLYTPANIAAGEHLFQLQCAHCHGSEAMGNGERAELMTDAKPRMLTNLYWLQQHGDLELLRSIKYGVPGTAMVAQGDVTNPVQRIQLVLYIRTLSQEKAERDRLQTLLYYVFDKAVLGIEECRIHEYTKLEKARTQYDQAYDERAAATVAADKVSAYRTELQFKDELDKRMALDEVLQQLIKAIQQERELYNILGETLIGKDVSVEMLDAYLEMVPQRALKYIPSNGCVEIKEERTSYPFEQGILGAIDNRLTEIQQAQRIAEGRHRSKKREEELAELISEQNSWTNMRTQIVSRLKESDALQKKQLALFAEYKSKRDLL